MGYTYDWFYGYNEDQYNQMLGSSPGDPWGTPTAPWAVRSFTELVLPPGADYWVASEDELQAYLASPLYAVPEPSTLLLVLCAILCLPFRARRRS